MRGAPDADHGDSEDAGKVHVGGVHGDHETQAFDYFQLFREGLFPREGGDICGGEGFELRCFLLAAEE